MANSKPTCEVDKFGDKRWTVFGKLHNENGPAIEFSDGTKAWYMDGLCHRWERDKDTGLFLPAVEWADGSKDWYHYGVSHRDEIDPETGLSLPAMILADGSRYHLVNGFRHCEDGPAIYTQYTIQYWINGNHCSKLMNKKIYGRKNLALCMLLL